MEPSLGRGALSGGSPWNRRKKRGLGEGLPDVADKTTGCLLRSECHKASANLKDKDSPNGTWGILML